jgi:anaerobic magnesium-protoporphyrin IX monomethyl ester cyclase
MKKLDILFVHPNASRKIYQDLSKDFSAIEPPIWAAMLCKYIANKGYSVGLLDCEADRISSNEAAQRIIDINPKVVCLVAYGQQPSASTQNMVGIIEIMNLLKDTNIVRVYTGPHPSSLPVRTIQDDPNALVCQGEGPRTLETLLQVTDYNDYSQLSKVPGLWYRNKDTNQILGNSPALLISNLDDELDMLPTEYLQLDKYRTANWHSWTNENNTKPFASIYTSLGCPFKCGFCMINSPFNNGDNKNNTFRNWSPENIIKKFEFFAANGITNIKIADEMFVYKRQHFLELCNLIIERKYKFNMWAYARIDTIKEEYLEILKNAGVNWLGLGIESANQVVRQEVTKGRFQELNIRDIVHKVKSYGIGAGGNYIFGLPKDNYESMNQTLQLALDLKTDYANFYCAMAYPGSQLHRDFSKNNPMALPENNNIGWIGYSQHAYETFNLPTEYLTNAEILKFRDDAFEKYFTNPEYLATMTSKFGVHFKNEMDRMLSIKLKRRLTEKL